MVSWVSVEVGVIRQYGTCQNRAQAVMSSIHTALGWCDTWSVSWVEEAVEYKPRQCPDAERETDIQRC